MELTIYLGVCPERIDVLLDKDSIDMVKYLRVEKKTINIPDPVTKKRDAISTYQDLALQMERDKKDAVYTTCYGERKKWPSKDEAIAFFREAAAHSDGCERERYTNIVMKLYSGEYDVDDQR